MLQKLPPNINKNCAKFYLSIDCLSIAKTSHQKTENRCYEAANYTDCVLAKLPQNERFSLQIPSETNSLLLHYVR